MTRDTTNTLATLTSVSSFPAWNLVFHAAHSSALYPIAADVDAPTGLEWLSWV